MTPIELRLEGFTCYRDRAVIDFTGPGTGLFAVTGPTGAGKSTLLDALTYALYGQTPRLGGRGLEALVSPGSPSMFVQLTFRAATGVYRVTRAAQRKPGGVASEVRVEQADAAAQHGGWRQLPASERVRDANKAIEEIVGLDYGGFTRAVLLPQGAFDEFLRGDVGERRRLLVSLLGLDRVEEVRGLASRIGRDAETVAKGLTSRLAEDYAGVGAGAVRELEERRTALQARAAALEGLVAEAEAGLAAAEERARLQAALAALQARRAELLQDGERVARIEAEVGAARRAAEVAPLIEAGERAAARLAGLVAKKESAEAKASARRAAADAAAAALAAVRAAADTGLPPAEEELAALAAASPALATLERLGGEVADVASSDATVGAGKLIDETAWGRLELAAGLLDGLTRAEAAVARARERLREAEVEAASAAAAAERLGGESEARTEAGKALRAEAERREAALRAAHLADAAAAVRAHVHVGAHCPVCGNVVGAVTGGGGDVEVAAAEAAASAAKQALERARVEFAEFKGRLGAAQTRASGTAQALAEARAGAEEAERELATALARVRELLAVAADARADAALLRATLETARREALVAHARAVAADLRAAGADLGALARVGAGARAAQLEREVAEHRSRLVAAAEAHAAAEREAAAAAGELAAAEERTAEAEGESTAAGERLLAGAVARGFAGVAAVRAALREPAALVALAAAVDEHRRDLGTVGARIGEVEAELLGLAALDDPRGLGAAGVAEACRTRLKLLRGERTEVAAALGTTAGELTRAKEALERKRALTSQLAEAEARAELHKQLATDLRSDRFQEYLMTHVQQRLARRASATLRNVTDGRFDLHLLDGDYLVADQWTGGELRSARTLSGGESFVASLALALALSDTLAGNAALGALFLDEGFGTLDAGTLEAVTAVLESLTDEGRMVGVITHVSELSERLPARLVVTKGQSGSTVAWDT
ncbi:MAG: AAA family ATPase [Trueperaceae bacterium]|nr:AAA family ATPase [Trueperaceae bacterium]MCC6311415.1 AAA family ATPase [Trueperaceae bacterium]MCO5174096.1 AAA family ATPase [Trueperaceae bacterium]